VQEPLAASTAPMRTRAPLLNWTLLGSFVLNMLSSSSGEPRGFEVDAPRQEALRGTDGLQPLVTGHGEPVQGLRERVVEVEVVRGRLELVEDVRGLVDGGGVEERDELPGGEAAGLPDGLAAVEGEDEHRQLEVLEADVVADDPRARLDRLRARRVTEHGDEAGVLLEELVHAAEDVAAVTGHARTPSGTRRWGWCAPSPRSAAGWGGRPCRRGGSRIGR